MGERAPGDELVHEVVRVLGELVEDHVRRVAREPLALVVDLPDVALDAGRPDDVGGIGDPSLEPLEPLAAHPLGQDRDPAAAHDAADRDAARGSSCRSRARPRDASVGSNAPETTRAARGTRRPRGPCGRRSSGTGRRARRRSGRRRRSGTLGRIDVLGNGDGRTSVGAVVPVDAEQVQRVGRVGVDRRERRRGSSAGIRRGLRELLERRQGDPGLPEPSERPLVHGVRRAHRRRPPRPSRPGRTRRPLAPPILGGGPDARGYGRGSRMSGGSGSWVKSNSRNRFPRIGSVLADRRPRVRPAHRVRVEPLPAEEQVLDQLQVRVERQRLRVDRARLGPTG